MSVPARSDRISPPDQAARDRITDDLGTTLFVEAGAGSGKTSALVDRVVALVTSGRAELRAVAAITFTEKAGAELRDRIRRELERRAEDDPGEVGARCRTALDQLDGAAIGTLHAFAQRLLTEHPVEAGLPPRVEVLDEVSSKVAFERRWSMFRDRLLADPDLERTILLLLASGVRAEALQSLAEAFDDNWDLVKERVPVVVPDPPSVHELFAAARAEVDRVCAEPCRDPTDKLRIRLDEIADRLGQLTAMTDELDLLEALGPNAARKLPGFSVGNIGKKASFDDVKDVQARVREAGDALASVCATVANACAERLGSAIRRFTLETATDRQHAGQLEFHDLLVLARALLRHPDHGPAVRVALHRRYHRLLLDEFQDTDPIQIELAVRIAADDPRNATAGEAPWDQVEVTPGHLFVVGDPKQSIYRFRRADIAVFLGAAERFGTEAGGVVELRANFRTVRPVIEWVNSTFAALMSEPDDVDIPVPSQPRYIALEPTRSGPDVGPPVAVLGRHEHPSDTSADELRAAEAGEVAATVVRAVGERWDVDDGRGGWRPARLGDITVLVPARTSLPFLEDAFDAAGIPFRAESSSLVYASRAVRDLLMVLRAVDDPTDHLRIVSALRTPLLACGDDDLFRFKVQRGGRWSYLADQPDTVPLDDPVHLCLRYLRSLYDERHWLAPSELLGRIAADRRALELGFAEGRPRDVWRRLRFVTDQARAWSEATGGNLRQYLRWVSLQTAEGARVAEAILPESDDDAVRVMTIHSAKGLEFPVTIVSGMSTVPQGRPAPAQVVFPAGGAVGYKFGKNVTTLEYAEWAPIDEQMSFHERIRLLYVACTRARDHLVVSLHRKARANPPASTKRTNAELLLSGMGELLDTLPDGAEPGDAMALAVLEPPTPPPPLEQWAAERTAALVRASRPTAVAATALTDEGTPDSGGEPDPGLEKRPRDLDLPPWLKGRYGTAVGRAVHGVLQTIDLGTGAGLDDALAAQCEAEAVPDRLDDVRKLVRDALGSPSVREAAARPHWREVYACTPIDGRLLEGYIDLLYRGPDGLVVVDHKTAATSDPDELDRRVEGYRIQGASYALTVAATTAEPVVRVTFLFLTPDGAVERHLSDLYASVAEVRRLVSTGNEIVTP
ncbi:MAG TPA: UvrD-helicase domain-containing protein [Acidimicrobiales bacterium]|nr:UvrD-helicase domain-containing protein [Acidimicrobiales bacterium]